MIHLFVGVAFLIALIVVALIAFRVGHEKGLRKGISDTLYRVDDQRELDEIYYLTHDSRRVREAQKTLSNVADPRPWWK